MIEEPTKEEVEKILNEIVIYVKRKKIEGIVLFFLESIKPLSFVAGELILYYLPLFIQPTSSPYSIAKVLRKRENLELLINKLKKLEENPRE